MQNKSHIQGFTLIEVLVALIIIAIACFAVLHVVSNSVGISTRLERHMVGTWLSTNVSNDLRANAISLDAATNSVSGSTLMLYQTWPWEAHIIQHNSFIGHYDQAIGVIVKSPVPPNPVIWRLQSYIPLKQTPNE